MIHTDKSRQEMIGKSYQSDMNNPEEMRVNVKFICKNGRGHTVVFTSGDSQQSACAALSAFVKRYPHEIKDKS